MKIGITGAFGFVGWHARAYLASRNEATEVRLAGRETVSDPQALKTFAAGLDLVLHFAGVNRAPDDELVTGNLVPAQNLVAALEASQSRPCVIYTSTTHALSPQNSYGKGKAGVTQIFDRWAAKSGARFIELVVPHVFGEYCRANYNSAVGTFCHQIATGVSPSVTGNGMLELIHAQTLAEKIWETYLAGAAGRVRVEGKPISVTEVVTLLQSLFQSYWHENRIPDTSDRFTSELLSSLRGAIPDELRVRNAAQGFSKPPAIYALGPGRLHAGKLTPEAGLPRVFHRRQLRRLLVIDGAAEIHLARLFSQTETVHQVAAGQFLDIPPLQTYALVNKSACTLLSWSDYDATTDTFAERTTE